MHHRCLGVEIIGRIEIPKNPRHRCEICEEPFRHLNPIIPTKIKPKRFQHLPSLLHYRSLKHPKKFLHFPRYDLLAIKRGIEVWIILHRSPLKSGESESPHQNPHPPRRVTLPSLPCKTHDSEGNPTHSHPYPSTES